MSVIAHPCLRRISGTEKPVTTEQQRRRRSINLPVWPTFILNMDKTKSKKKTVKFPSSVLMQQAISDGDVQEMKQLVSQYGSGLVLEPEPSGLPPVMRAIFECQQNSLKYLVELGADLKAQDQEGWNSLHVAAAMDDLEAARYVVQNSRIALTQVHNVDGARPIDLAESVEMATFLLEADLQGCSGSEESGHFDTASVEEMTLLGLLQAHCEQSENHRTPNTAFNSLLHLAAEKNYPRLAKYILERNLVNTEVRDRNGWTSLHVAAFNNSVDVTLLLVEYGASVQKLTTDSYEKPSDLTENELIHKILASVRLH